MTREPTEDEIRLYEILVDELFPHGTRLELNDGIAIVRAIIDGIRPMTERQWEALPGLGKPWKDLSSGEVWQCFLESISPRIEPDPPAPPPKPYVNRTELPLCPMRSCAENGRCDFSVGRHCGHRPDTLEHWQAVHDANVRRTIAQATALGHLDGDDNAFAGEVDLSELRSGKDRRNGDRRIFEATCLTANKRNLNREDRRQGERRKP